MLVTGKRRDAEFAPANPAHDGPSSAPLRRCPLAIHRDMCVGHDNWLFFIVATTPDVSYAELFDEAICTWTSRNRPKYVASRPVRSKIHGRDHLVALAQIHQSLKSPGLCAIAPLLQSSIAWSAPPETLSCTVTTRGNAERRDTTVTPRRILVATPHLSGRTLSATGTQISVRQMVCAAKSFAVPLFAPRHCSDRRRDRAHDVRATTS